MNPVALDLSLTRTGWACAGLHGVLVPPKHADRGMERLSWIRGAVIGLIETWRAQLVVLEGYGFAAGRGHAPHDMGELGGVIRLCLFENGIPYVVIAPATLKAYATGRGNAPKELVLVEAVKRLKYDGADHNEADALWLRAIALDHYGAPVVEMPKANRAWLAKVKWPVVADSATGAAA